jgi:sortase A
LACLAIISGLGIGAHIALYLHHSDTEGRALVHQEEHRIAKADASGQCNRAAPTSAASTDTTTPVTVPGANLASTTPGASSTIGSQQVQVVLKIPKLGLLAPVLQGDDDPQLDVGVGHIPASAWPGLSGTDVLSAHDVTWFSHINRLNVGDNITIVTPCHTFGYTVVNHTVVEAGSPIYQTLTPRLFLVTCYPLNALFLTPKRYLVEAKLTSLTTQGVVTSPPGSTGQLPTLTAPPDLVAEQLDLVHNEQPLGVLSFAGAPSSTWQQSSVPLQAEALALELYFAALKSGGQNEPAWWAAIAPNVPFGNLNALVGASIASVTAAVHPTLIVQGSTLTGATITSSLRLIDDDAPGTYLVTMNANVVNNQLVITGFTLQPST